MRARVFYVVDREGDNIGVTASNEFPTREAAERALRTYVAKHGYRRSEYRIKSEDTAGKKAGGMAKLTGEKKRAFLAKMEAGRRKAGIGTGKKKPGKKKGAGKRAGTLATGRHVWVVTSIQSGKRVIVSRHRLKTSAVAAQKRLLGRGETAGVQEISKARSLEVDPGFRLYGGKKAAGLRASGKPGKKKGAGKRAGRMTVGPAVMPAGIAKLQNIANGNSGKTPWALHATVTTLAQGQLATISKVVELDGRMGAVEGWMAGRKRLGKG